MKDQVVSFGPDSFKILGDGTVIVESQKLKDLIATQGSRAASFEILDAWLEVGPQAT
jgi:hypothetical protein